ncbi:MAG: response regulator transcription factor [Gammaproteobacteria bacterium]|nr:MAG: response regulator transcription factor [Gammaproteobacteria bacterium]
MRGGNAAHRGARRRSRQSGSRRRLRHSWHARAGRAGRRRAARGDAARARLRGHGAAPGTRRTLILTTFDDSDVVLDGIRAGARGFLLKDVSYQQLLAAIRAVAGGATVFQPAITERLLRAGTAPHVDMEAPREPLTVREAEVVRLMAGGYSNREIAAALGTAEGTVKNHVSSILAKFGVRDRTRAVLKALESGVLRAPGPGTS